tara:strand:+ start:276 stop:764 length:489 start_codon:yes stop_codon:yes gene_type:complete
MEIMKILEKNILNIVSGVCNVPANKIIRNRKATRQANVVVSRQVLVNMLWRNFNYTNHMVKDILGYKNHASVVHSRSMHETDYKYDMIYRNMYNKCMEQLGLYVNDEDIEASRNRDMKKTIEEQDKQIGKYKDLWLNEKIEKEKYQQELITFRKKYIPNKYN